MKVLVKYQPTWPATPWIVEVGDEAEETNWINSRVFAEIDTAINWLRKEFTLTAPLEAFTYAQVNGSWRSWVEGQRDVSLSAIDLEIRRLQHLRREKMVEAAAATAEALRADHEQLRLGQLNAKLDKYNITFAESRRLRLQGRLKAMNPEVLGHIDGLPTMHGLLIASDGIIGILIRGPKLWAEVHVANFVAEEGQDDSELRVMKKERVKPTKTMEELVNMLKDLI